MEQRFSVNSTGNRTLCECVCMKWTKTKRECRREGKRKAARVRERERQGDTKLMYQRDLSCLCAPEKLWSSRTLCLLFENILKGMKN